MEGENYLVSVGKTLEGKEVKDEIAVNYRFTKNGKARALKLGHSKLDNGNYLVKATAIDKNGLRCLDYEKRVYFQCLNGGEAVISQGTPTGSEIIEMANGMASIEIKRLSDLQPIEIMVLNQSFKGTYLTID